jgi:hypothetical protein
MNLRVRFNPAAIGKSYESVDHAGVGARKTLSRNPPSPATPRCACCALRLEATLQDVGAGAWLWRARAAFSRKRFFLDTFWILRQLV